MPIEISMPRLSDTMQQGTIVKWNVKEGQTIKSGDVIADIETDKATMELQSFDDGTVARLGVAEGQTVPVGTVILVLAGKGEDAAAIKSGGGVSAAPVAKVVANAGSNIPSVPAGTATIESEETIDSNGARVFISPLAKKIARESGIDLASVQGSGPGGRIVRRDVEAAISGSTLRPAPASSPASAAPIAKAAPVVSASGTRLSGEIVSLSNMRRTIARRLVESKTTIPHYQVTIEVAMDALIDLRKQLNEQLETQGVKLSVNDFLVRACALAMHKHPFVNSRWVGNPGSENIELLANVNIGVAIALDESKGGGLVVATLRDADQIGLRQISAQSRALADKARTKGLTIEEMADATFTISNLGMFGVDHFTAIINPPNVAILAVGAAIQKPVVRGNEVVPGWVMSMTMSSDHRVVDGAMAAAYLNSVKALLEKPATLLV
ncbi:MAG: 2-oxo acid dehydrogenase subunit E2 [Phycisphaerales bacterium]|jgi:pyruvate dehydrogenase E2 component (dihydrolipoamide acetyltransferase)|nr:2-oxo acid dehydrogenase subunit E2 [Phycisphaerales bacterium]